MADYIPILNSQLEPKAPVTSELMFQLRDNPIAITEGAVGAPRNVLKSIERLVAGDSVRSRFGPEILPQESSFGIDFNFVQIGTIRASISGAVSSYDITRTRNGDTVSMLSGGGTATVDISVIPGDNVNIAGISSGGTCTASLGTNGVNLWPSAMVSNLEGNNV